MVGLTVMTRRDILAWCAGVGLLGCKKALDLPTGPPPPDPTIQFTTEPSNVAVGQVMQPAPAVMVVAETTVPITVEFYLMAEDGVTVLNWLGTQHGMTNAPVVLHTTLSDPGRFRLKAISS